MYSDLNCDLGEGAGNDSRIMPWITSANIACGGHAGDEGTIRETIRLALKFGVRIGAHPGYPDREGFGRVSLVMGRQELFDTIVHQIKKVKESAESLGGSLVHVKPHGALYNDAAMDPAKARIIAEAVRAVDPRLVLIGLAGSALISESIAAGLKAWQEVFADRAYAVDGKLVSRSQPGALIQDPEVSLIQVRRMLEKNEIVTSAGTIIPVHADTVCLHGDEPGAPHLAEMLSQALNLKRSEGGAKWQ